MKVKELIEKLNEFPKEMLVLVNDHHGIFEEAKSVFRLENEFVQVEVIDGKFVEIKHNENVFISTIKSNILSCEDTYK